MKMLAGLAVCGFFLVTGFASAQLPPLIPRDVIFGNPDKVSPQISPDGKRLAYIAPDEGVLNVWVRTIGSKDDRAVTKDRNRGIRSYFWAENNEHILYIQDKGGDENWHVHSVDLASGKERDLTPKDGVQAQIISVERKFPDEILVGLNDRNPQLHDAYRINIRTGESKLEALNDKGYVGWVADVDMRIRAAQRILPTAGTALDVRDAVDSEWRTVAEWGMDDALGSGPTGFTHDGKGMFLISSKGSNTAQLRELDLASGKEKVLASDENADVSGVMQHPDEHHIQAVAFTKKRQEWQILDPEVKDDFAAISKLNAGDFGIINRDHADQTWLVYFTVDDGPVYYYTYDRKSKKGELLFSNRKSLEGLKLAKMEPVEFKSSDGMVINGYLTLPVGVEPKNLPTVINIHGGPWARDTWGYDGESQWFANRGYATLQINFRGSTGYGKKFLNAANREWGAKMHDDILAGVKYLVDKGIADPKRIGTYGGSYGGYASLVGMTFTPDVFACGVSIVGPSNLITFMNTIPPYWKPAEPILFERVGNPGKDADFLKSRSPLYKVDQIKNPLLIAQGANDPRVNKDESMQIVEAMKKAGKEVEYVEYADEGHGFARPENRLDFYGRAEKFLAKHLGGRFEEVVEKTPEAKPKSQSN